MVVVNNYPQNEEQIKNIIFEFSNCNATNWELGLLNRPITLPPVENWYSAVKELALDDEIVFFVGDDDPLPSKSIKTRYDALLQSDATMVFGKINHGVFFSSEAKYVFETARINDYTEKVFKLDIGDIWDWTAIHLSNHCFVNNQLFANALEEAFAWCDLQQIGTLENRRLFITYYIPLALSLKKGRIIGIDIPVLNRGISIEEVRNTKFSIRSWNLGYISGLALHMLNNESLKEINQLDQIRNHFKDVFQNWIFAIKYDDRISESELKELMSANKICESAITFKNKLFSIRLILKYILRLQAYPLYLKNLIFRVPSKSVRW